MPSIHQSVDGYLQKTFDKDDYHCLHFARDVWLELTGHDISEALATLLEGPRLDRHVDRRAPRKFVRLAQPEDPCLVLMQRPRAGPHVGVFLRGSVLHLHERGAEFAPLDVATRAHLGVKYYRCRP